VATLLTGCAPAEPAASPREQRAAERATQLIRVVNRDDPLHLTHKPIGGAYTGRLVPRMFNAGIAYQDERQNYHPELAESLPQLNTDAWRVFPDGQMETTYKLKPNLTWHDGTPLSAEDFVFSFQVYTSPELGQAGEAPQKSMREVIAPDARTVVIRWRELYPGADSISRGDGQFGNPLPPLPRHILDEPLRRGNADAFASHPYWTTEYVGLGPFRLDRWERGAFLEGVAFDGYALGRPKLDRIRVVFHNDPNTVTANFLAGEVDLNAEEAVRPELGLILRQEWESRGTGVVRFFVSQGRRTDIQLDPSRANPPTLLDLRVRRAVAHAIDREALNQGVQEGLGQGADTWVTPEDEIFPEVDRVIAKYPHDPQRAGQLLAEAGYTRGADGFFVSAAGERLTMELSHNTDPSFSKESAIMADTMKRSGIDISIIAVPRQQWSIPSNRPNFSALSNQGGGELENLYGTVEIPNAENRYTGRNRGSWLSPEYDRLQSALGATLDRTQRKQQLVQMAKIVSEEVPGIPLYYRVKVTAQIPQLQGVVLGDRVGAYWNVHQWELR
jgi:peptide/nickel transport system substrate-binding protein